jgi:HEAT repeat protein
VRHSAILGLGMLGDPTAVSALVAVVRDEAKDALGHSFSAAKALASCGPEGRNALVELAEDSDADLAGYGAVGLEPPYPHEITDEREIRALVKNVEDPASMGFGVLVNARVRLAADLLLPMLDHPSAEVRQRAVHSIWVHGDDDVIAKLSQLLLEDPDPGVRRQAAWGLGVSHRPQAKPALLEAIASDRDHEVVDTSRKSLRYVEAGRIVGDYETS